MLERTNISCQIFQMIYHKIPSCWKAHSFFFSFFFLFFFFSQKESKIRFLQISKKTPQPLSSHTDLSLKATSCLSEGPGALKMLLVLTLPERGWRTSSISLPQGTRASPARDSSAAPQPSLRRKPNLVGVCPWPLPASPRSPARKTRME